MPVVGCVARSGLTGRLFFAVRVNGECVEQREAGFAPMLHLVHCGSTHAPANLIGLDPRQIIEIRQLIRQLAGNRTVILSTHILPEVAQVCERVVIINDGRVAVDGMLADLTRQRSLEEVFLQAVSRDSGAGATTADDA